MSHHRRNSESRKYDTTTLADRESSFHESSVRWPASLPNPESMAEAGFYFTPNDKNQDCCTCYRCGIKMYNWLPDDTPKSEHKRFSPSCKEVKSWPGFVVENERAIHRAEQTDSKLRLKIADKLSKRFHRKHDIKQSSSKEAPAHIDHHPEPAHNDSRPLNDDEKLADIRRRREVAEKSLDGLEKLASFYPVGSQEQKRAEESITAQAADLEKIRQEEERLVASMGALSFGRGWHDVTESPAPQYPSYKSAPSSQPSESVLSDEDSPEISRGRASVRPLPQLPSQLNKMSLPRMPTKMTRSQSIDNSAYDAALQSEPAMSEWIEYFTDDGIPYYYSTITKNTVWQLPSTSQPVA